MTKYIVTFLLSFLSCATVLAQGADPWVGTWTSESYKDIDWDNSPGEEIVYASFKRIIRITKNEGEYTVRSKIIKVGDPDYSYYSPAFTIKKVEGNNMWLESYVEKSPFTVNGKIDSYRDVTHCFKLSLKQGILHYSYEEFHYVEDNSRMIYKEEGTVKVGGAGSNLDLFTDDW